ncbi:hypothetical protein HMPREF9431_02405 [Segatella oulorum F0390]|uniref:Uncharacterized protein n=1 Tax=Segatella oulorum F0390 TaxID=702438 RepID=G1WEW8_9BACT|nr:hypothetical protein [Segatella oulorum]EGV28968.1 hypothetical protein HMPREF9431_02405 [Segatella oulorum F0390]
MKRSLITFGILFSLCLSMGLFTACSTEEEQAQPRQNLVNLAAKGKIILSMQDFNTAREITRAVQAPTDTQVVDLDNGMTAEISVERGRKRKTAATRASDILNGHFNLYALNPATNQRVGNLLKGTVKTTYTWISTPTPGFPWGHQEAIITFTPDGGLSLMLAPGTYKFVCYNDAVEDDGTNLTIKNSVDNPLIGSTTATIPANSIEYKVDIEMKHPAVRCLVSLKNLIGSGEPTAGFVNMKGRLNATTTKAIQYSADLTSKTVIPGTDILDFPFGANNTIENNIYLYVLPGVGTDMKLEFYNGTCYYNSVGTLKTSLAKLGTMSANDDYKLNIKINPSYKYLFNDGTTGYLRDKGTRTPIGIVVRRKTAVEKGLAVALNLASTSQERAFTSGYLSGVYTYYVNKRVISTLTDAFTDMDGYAYTWDANTSSNNEVKAFSDKYPAFKLAANYNPGVPTSGIGQWFLPSLGQIKLMMTTIGFSRKLMSNQDMQGWAYEALNYGFSKAGASNPPVKDGWMQSVCSSTRRGNYSFWYYWANSSNGFYDSSVSAYVLPFVEF